MAQIINGSDGVKTIEIQNTPQDAGKRKKKEVSSTKIPAGVEKRTIVIQPQTMKDNEMRCYRINGKPYYIKTGIPVEVPKFLADHVMHLAKQKKLSAQLLQKYSGNGVSLGDLG